MKKLLLSSIVLLLFTISILLFQVSCKKEANAQTSPYVLPTATTTRLGGVMPDGTTITVDGNGKISAALSQNSQENKILFVKYGAVENTDELWTANFDGTNASKVNISVPSGLAIGDNHFALSPDHKTVFLSMITINSGKGSIYACNIDGGDLHKVIDGGSNGVDIGVTY